MTIAKRLFRPTDRLIRVSNLGLAVTLAGALVLLLVQ